MLRRGPKSTVAQLDKYRAGFASAGSGLVLAGVGPDPRHVLERTGILDRLGEKNVIAPDPHPGLAFERCLRRGEELLDELRAASSIPSER